MNKKIIIITSLIALALLILVFASFSYLNRKKVASNRTYDAQRFPTIAAEQNAGRSQANDDPYIFPPTKDELAEEQEFYKIQYPDVFVVNNLPYETTSFTVTHQPLRSDGVYVIQVTAKIQSGAQVQQEFIAWLGSLGLTPEQISSLTIEYQ